MRFTINGRRLKRPPWIVRLAFEMVLFLAAFYAALIVGFITAFQMTGTRWGWMW